MVYVILVIFGLCLGSFVNALVWRLREQELLATKPKKTKKTLSVDLSIVHGRSICPNCHTQLHSKDLVPVLSWISLGGKCRYCNKPISRQYPLVEVITATLFASSYFYWPMDLNGAQISIFILWLLLLVGFMALAVYDLRWYLLPNRIMYPLLYVAGLAAFISIVSSHEPLTVLLRVVAGVGVGGGIFYMLFQVSKGKWIGGGDVKLGAVLGLVVGSPSHSFLFIFLAAVGGSLVSLPLLATKRLKPTTVIPFGPFLIAGAVITMLFGGDILHWYQNTLLAG